MLIEPSWWTDLKGLIVSTCSGGTLTKIFRAADINREDWRQAIDNTQLVPPFWVIHLKETSLNTEFSPVDGYAVNQPVIIYGIYSTTSVSAEIASGSWDPTALVWSEGCNLRDALFAYLDAPTVAQFNMTSDGYPIVDVSDDNPANAKLLADGNDLMAFQLKASLVLSYLI